MRARARAGEAGFTLVEVLISMFIFSLISTGAFIALSTTLDAREAVEARTNALEQLAAMRRLMADDVGTSTLRQNRDGLGDPLEDAGLLDPERLVLTRRGRPNPGGAFARSDLLRVAWEVDGGQLVRRFLPHENPAQIAEPVARVVLDGVERMEVERVLGRTTLNTLLEQADTLGGPLQQALIAQQRQQSTFPDAGMIGVRLFHADGTQTRHLFTWDPL